MWGRFSALAVMAALMGASPAAAADQAVNIGNDKTISPVQVTIDPGDTVTWHWVGPDTNHSTTAIPLSQAESWDSDAGVATAAIDHPLNDTFPHTFNEPGEYFYGCRVHDEMRGRVLVNAPPPPPPPPPPPAPPAQQPSEPPPADSAPADPAPAPMPGPTPTALTPRAPVPPALTLGGPSRQRLAARRPAVLITARCDGNCGLAATGRLTVAGVRRAYKLRAARATLNEAGQARLRLAVPPSVVKAVKKGLRRRKRVAAVVTVTATGPGGAATSRRSIRLR